MRPKKRAKPKPKRGRKRIKRDFDQTRVGFFLKHEAPTEYKLIVESLCNNKSPSADVIEQIGYSSMNPLFKKPKFRRALIHYRKYGLYCGHPIDTDAQTELYYIRIRKKTNDDLKKY